MFMIHFLFSLKEKKKKKEQMLNAASMSELYSRVWKYFKIFTFLIKDIDKCQYFLKVVLNYVFLK